RSSPWSRRAGAEERPSGRGGLECCLLSRLPSVHIRSPQSRALQSRLGLRDAAVRARTGLLNVVHSYLRTTGERVRSGASQTLVDRVRERLGERAAVLETVFAPIESLNVAIAGMTKAFRNEARHDELSRQRRWEGDFRRGSD